MWAGGSIFAASDIAEDAKVRDEVLVAFARGDVRFLILVTGVARKVVDDDDENRADEFDRQGTRDVRGVLMLAVIDRKEMAEEDILVETRDRR